MGTNPGAIVSTHEAAHCTALDPRHTIASPTGAEVLATQVQHGMCCVVLWKSPHRAGAPQRETARAMWAGRAGTWAVRWATQKGLHWRWPLVVMSQGSLYTSCSMFL